MSSPESSPLIAARALSVRYGKRLALDGLSLAVPPGSVYALLGRNGAGKSTLVRCLLGEHRPASGDVLLLGRDVWQERAAVLAEVGVVPEEPDAPPGMTAPQIARFCSRLYPRWDAKGLAERLERFGVPDDVPFGRLSKGQKGQVALALALAPSPRLLMLDDPTLGLDPAARHAFFGELIGELADRGTTVFLTTHDLAAVEGIADRVGILQAGKLLLDDEMESLKRRFRRISFPGQEAAAIAERSRELELFAPVAVAARGWAVEAVVSKYDEGQFDHFQRRDGRRFEVSSLTLEEIFLALVGETRGETKGGR
jgi:ABC-2 type transport system ATP-binding protein